MCKEPLCNKKIIYKIPIIKYSIRYIFIPNSSALAKHHIQNMLFAKLAYHIPHNLCF